MSIFFDNYDLYFLKTNQSHLSCTPGGNQNFKKGNLESGQSRPIYTRDLKGDCEWPTKWPDLKKLGSKTLKKNHKKGKMWKTTPNDGNSEKYVMVGPSWVITGRPRQMYFRPSTSLYDRFTNQPAGAKVLLVVDEVQACNSPWGSLVIRV